MARKKRLNIHNTDQVFNLQIVERHKEIPVTYVTPETVRRIVDQELTAERLPKHYHMRLSEIDVADIRKVCEGAELFTLEIDKKPTKELIQILADNRKNGRAVFTLKEDYTHKEVQELIKVSEVISVTVSLQPILGETDISAVIIALSNIRYRVDKLQLVFPSIPLTAGQERKGITNYYKKKESCYDPKMNKVYGFFNELRDTCSHWKINIIIEVSNSNQKQQLVKLSQKDTAGRKKVEL